MQRRAPWMALRERSPDRQTLIVAAQQSLYGTRAVAEDAIQLSSDQRQRERPCGLEWQPILHAIRHARTSRALGKRVQMRPLAIRPADLFVDKLMVRLPLSNSGAPVKGHSEEPQTIVDDCALLHSDRGRRQDLKSELRRRDAFEVFSIGEECYRRAARTLHRLIEVRPRSTAPRA